MRQAACQLTDRLHLAGLAQCFLNPIPIGCRFLQLSARVHQFAGALGDLRLQPLVRPQQCRLGRLAVRDIGDDAQQMSRGCVVPLAGGTALELDPAHLAVAGTSDAAFELPVDRGVDRLAEHANRLRAVFRQHVAQEQVIAPGRRGVRIAEDLHMSCCAGHDAGRQIELPATKIAGFQGEAKALLLIAHQRENAQAVHRGSDQVGVAAQESYILLVELPRRAAVDLQDPERRPAAAADDGDVGDRADTVLDQERWIGEPRLRRDVGRDHRLAGLEGVALRGVAQGVERDLAHNPGLPAHPRAHAQRHALLSQLHHLGEVGAETLTDETAGFAQDLVQVTRLQCELAEPG